MSASVLKSEKLERLADYALAERIVKKERYLVFSLATHRTSEAIQELEKNGFQWLSTIVLYHPTHWTPKESTDHVDLLFFGENDRPYGLVAITVDAKMAANNGRAIP